MRHGGDLLASAVAAAAPGVLVLGDSLSAAYGIPAQQGWVRLLQERLGVPVDIEFASDGERARGYLALPASGRGPGVIVIQEWWGLNDHIKAIVDRLAREGVKKVHLVCPGFSADCLETLEEIAMQYQEVFEEAGGERFEYIPALNEAPDHIDMLAQLTQENLQGWITAQPVAGTGDGARKSGLENAGPEAAGIADRTRIRPVAR